jgi:hypothetical protein
MTYVGLSSPGARCRKLRCRQRYSASTSFYFLRKAADAVQDADQAVAERAQRGVVTDAAGSRWSE